MDNTQGKIRFGASSAPHKLKLIMLIVNRDKVEFYTDFLQDFEVNMQAVTMAHGTASTETLQLLGLEDTGKAVVLGVIREGRAAEALDALSHKFRTIRGGSGIAWTIPLTSTIGVALYRFLSNNRQGAETKWNTPTK